jgi:formate dehydrogenase major subunit
VLDQQGASPLPPWNFRFGHRTPQNGVEVERKWNKTGYNMPGSTPQLVQIELQNADKMLTKLQ